MTVEQVPVALGQRRYDIHIAAGLLADAAALIRPLLPRPRLAVVVDEAVWDSHGKPLRDRLDDHGIQTLFIPIQAGEGTKTLDGLNTLLEALLDAQVERGDVIACMGGGVIGDLGGFAASVLRRGVDFIQIPTTLLAQVDSSVGGKTGVNAKQGKNLIGAFHQPRQVLIDPDTLRTLPKREMLAGYAEVVKYGVINQPDFFTWLERMGQPLLTGDGDALTQAISRSCRAKAEIVAQDEREGGVRALLNLGHTFGHAIEALGGYDGRVLHGEAVAAGMAMALRYSVAEGLCDQADADRLEAHLTDVGLPIRAQTLLDNPDPDALLSAMRQDKKVAQGRLTLILARGIGKAFVAKDVDDAALAAFLAADLARA